MVKGGGNIPSDMMSEASYIRKGNDDMQSDFSGM